MKKRRIAKSFFIILLCGFLSVVHSVPSVAAEGVPTDETVTETATETDVVYAPVVSDSVEHFDEKKGIANVRLMYVADSGARDIIKSGYAFFVGDDSSVYLVSCCDTVILTDAEKESVAASHGVEKDRVKTELELVLKGDVTMTLSIVNSSEVMNFAILQPQSALASCTTLRLCEDANSVAKGDMVHSFDENMDEIECGIEDWSEIGEAHYYRYKAEKAIVSGLPLINEDGEVVGIVSRTNKGDVSQTYALQIDEVIAVMDVLGITYNPVIEIDASELQTAILQYEDLDANSYNTESWIMVKQIYDEAKKLLEDIEAGNVTSYTKEQLSDVTVRLNTSIEQLEKRGISGKQVIKYAVIIGIVLLLIIVALVVVLILTIRKYKKQITDQVNKSMQAKEALRLSGRVTPGALPNTSNHRMPENRSLGEMSNEGVVMSFGETSVLNTDVNVYDTSFEYSQEQIGRRNMFPSLYRVKNGESVIIKQNTFVLGTASDSVDFHIRYNSNISRKHACILKFQDGYYIQDMNTTNGTYVNGVKVEPGNYVRLMNNSVVLLADEEFVYRE